MLKDQLQADMIAALKAGNKLELGVLRMVISEIKYAEIDKHKELTDEEIISVLQKEMKKRKEAIELFKKNGRNDIAQEEEKQVGVIEKYLPKQLSREEIEQLIEESMKRSGTNPKMGQIIGMVMGSTKGRADGKLVADLVRQKLSV